VGYSITTKDGITIDDIPDDVSPDDPSLKAQVAELRAQRGSQAQEAEPGPKVEPETTLSGLGGALTRGLAPVATGAAIGGMLAGPPGAAAGAGAAGLTQLVADPVVGLINELTDRRYALPSELIQGALTRLGVAEPKTGVERVLQQTAAGAANAISGAATGHALAQSAGPVARALGTQLAAQPAAQLAGGAAGGAASQVAQEAGGGAGAQLAAGLVGSALGARGAGARLRIPKQLPDDLAQAEKFGVRLLTSDVRQPRSFVGRAIQAAGERVPLAGTGGIRKAQQAERIAAARNVLRDFGADDAASVSDDVMRDLAQKRAGKLSQYTGAKQEVLSKLAPAGAVPVPKTLAAIDDEIAQLQALKSEAYRPVIKTLEDWKQSIQGQNLPNIEQLRKQVGEAFSAPDLTAVRSSGEKALSRIYAPLREEMGVFIRARGERRDFDKWMIANRRLAEMSDELKMGALKSVLKTGSATPEAVNRLLFSAKPSEVRMLYQGLTPDGRASARTAILARAA
jgi:hypothetical protein